MEDYCAQDVDTNVAMFEFLEDKFPYDRAEFGVKIENKVAQILVKQTQRGVAFDREAAIKLHGQLAQRQMELAAELAEVFPPFYLRDGQMVRPKKPRRAFTVHDQGGVTRKYKKEIQTGWWNEYENEYVKIKLVDFNPSSRQHISNRLMSKYNWKPTELTPSGEPAVDEKVLSGLLYPEAKLLLEYLLLDKRLGQIAEGKQAWLKQDRDGMIHGQVKQNGTRTTRASHHSPNLGQVPKVGKPWGSECRACFGSWCRLIRHRAASPGSLHGTL
jgi:DNA polymerase I-like protein with 3'-5' exonuclease and polymerase domains